MNDADKTARPIGILEQIIPFAIKTCIVAAAISVCALFLANTVIENLEDSAARTMFNLHAQLGQRPIGVRQAVWAKMEQELDLAASPSSDFSPEEKQKLINDVRVIVARWRPFIEAAQSEMQKPAAAN
jgi:hypothetical protein